MKWPLLFPFVASLLYIAAALFLKRAQQLGGGVLRTTFIANVAIALVFATLWPMGGPGQPATQLWQPALVAVLFVAGQVFTVLALSLGDVSVATPVLGAKTIFVAWFTTLLLATRLPWQLWCAAGLSFSAIALLHRAPRGEGAAAAARHGRLGRTLFFSLLAAGAYALFDVLVQKWVPAWGTGRFLPIMFALSAVMSVGFVPFIREPWREVPRAAWPALGAGAFFMALQSFAFVTGVAMFGDATAMNVVYSARGVWSVAAVWLIGHWFANTEAQLGGGVFRWRLAGAALMTSAIVLVVSR
ncbi:MAG: DMT family transporter [Chthoniobacter sp.]|uniref:DMT family transporter n=1 Tax=Chthoniobacter sp. TaxID=2510640 RepID=UPI0032AD2C59